MSRTLLAAVCVLALGSCAPDRRGGPIQPHEPDASSDSDASRDRDASRARDAAGGILDVGIRADVDGGPPGRGEGEGEGPREGEGEGPAEGEGEGPGEGEGEGEPCDPALGGVEVCDGLDNDCDGFTDEGLDDVGEPCGVDEGTCSKGVWDCRQGEMWCLGIVGPERERCDRLDNDCDGETDEEADLRGEGPFGGRCGSESGECVHGVTRCLEGQAVCDGGVSAVPEQCDDLDNDCDGVTDEDGICGIVEARLAMVGLPVPDVLALAGYEVEALDDGDVIGGALVDGGFDAAFLGRHEDLVAPALLEAVAAFVLQGGGLVTEYDGHVGFFSGMHASMGLPDLPQLGWFAGDVGGGGVLQLNWQVRIRLRDDPLADQVPDPIRGFDGTERFFTLYEADPDLAVVATFRGNGAEGFPDEAFPALIRTQVCGAPVVFGMFDWADGPGEPALRQLVLNMAAVAAGPGGEDVPGVCPRD